MTIGDILNCKDMLMRQRGSVYRFKKENNCFNIFNEQLTCKYTTWSVDGLKSALINGNIEFMRRLDKRSNMNGW